MKDSTFRPEPASAFPPDQHPEGMTPAEHAEVTQEYATYGKNPRKELVGKRKKAIAQLELCQESIARMGAVYEQFNEQEHSDYLQQVYNLLETARMFLKEFAGDQ